MTAATPTPDSGASFRVGYGSAAPASRVAPRGQPLHAQAAMSDASLASLLRCPRCPDAPLKSENEAWVCTGCATRFPLLDGLPWLFAEPAATLGEWRDRLHRLLLELKHDAERVRIELAQEKLRSLTRSRLKLLSSAVTEAVSVQGASEDVIETVTVGPADPSVRLRGPATTARVTVTIVPVR